MSCQLRCDDDLVNGIDLSDDSPCCCRPASSPALAGDGDFVIRVIGAKDAKPADLLVCIQDGDRFIASDGWNERLSPVHNRFSAET